MKKYINIYIVCCMLSFIFSGCGYTFRSNLPKNIQRVYVENFNNRIEFTQEDSRYSGYFPGLENDISRFIEERFIMEGTLRLTDRRDLADLVLSGELVHYTRQPLRYEGDEVKEYRISIGVNCIAMNMHKDEIMWQGRVIGDSTYFLRGVLAKTESQAVDEAVEDLARRVVEKVVIQW